MYYISNILTCMIKLFSINSYCANVISTFILSSYIFTVTYYVNNLLVTTTVMVALFLPIGLVTLHVYVPLSLVVTLLME